MSGSFEVSIVPPSIKLLFKAEQSGDTATFELDLAATVDLVDALTDALTEASAGTL